MERLSRKCCTWGRSCTWTCKGTASAGSPSTQNPTPSSAPQGSPGDPRHPLPWDSIPWGARGGCRTQTLSPPRSPPRHKDAHLVGIALEGGGEGGHGTRQPSSEHGGADQGPLLGGAGISIRPSPSIVPPAPNPPPAHQLQDQGVLRGAAGPAWAGRGGRRERAGQRKADFGCCRGAAETPPKKKTYSQAGDSGVLALLHGEPREVGSLIAGLRWGARGESQPRSPGLAPSPNRGYPTVGGLTPFPWGEGRGCRAATLPTALQPGQLLPAGGPSGSPPGGPPGGHRLQGGTRDVLAPIPSSLPPSPGFGGREPQVPTALPAGSLCPWGGHPQDRRTGGPSGCQRRAPRHPLTLGDPPQSQSSPHPGV